MGIYDSTKTRVVPVFNRLLDIDSTGRTWLSLLLDLTSGPDEKATSPLGNIVEAKWWPDEKKLSAPRPLLEWLIKNLNPPRSESDWGSGKETIRKRKNLVNHDEQTIEEAVNLLKKNYKEGVWYVLEGPSYPDVYLETPGAVIIIEGKRTEQGPKTNTTWMENRHQMIRHLDCAYELHKNEKQIYGMMIVESDNGKSVPDKWLQYENQIKSDVILDSNLPHRLKDERNNIRDSFLGITTWQRICTELDIPFEVLITNV